MEVSDVRQEEGDESKRQGATMPATHAQTGQVGNAAAINNFLFWKD